MIIVRDPKIVFKNTGEGNAEEDIDKIFGQFYRTNEVRHNYEGSYGPGLLIVQNIVEQLGGNVSVISHVNKEAEFTIYLSMKNEIDRN